MDNIIDASRALCRAWPSIRTECLSVLGSELHYQAMIYHCLRSAGNVPISQLGMNVKMFVRNPVSPLFQQLSNSKKAGFQGGFEPIPDVVIFSPDIQGDWRRRNQANTLTQMLVAIEVKVSERHEGRLAAKEIITDIEKLAAHRMEATHLGGQMLPVMMIIDSAPTAKERMTKWSLDQSISAAKRLEVEFMYCSEDHEYTSINADK